MKTLALLLIAMLAADTLAACGSNTTTSPGADAPAQAKVTGLSTPKSVAVVTAN